MELSIGAIISGKISGIKPYGIFVQLNQANRQGLIHISECKNGYIADINRLYRIGQKITVQILDIDEYTRQISLSLRTLQKLSYDSRHFNKKKYWTDNKKHLGYQTIADLKGVWMAEAK
ncbi:CvfD/Ygs/GSP13 family RNA-binding post-transcriptional regulator [Bombilactobacillus folatiphilus]|uniref:CvfD/Ygs/GSP13 family RNA-binding post-transcriptional regulator n=1 Tax=Bombilactobacillus folatiphilus TaxID=2923362 RepID=A0ABY4P9W1_9LACO|nr:CvfD/Ygs/GSP13 family RNA-binding post-transcriptional regulator [Bombilactobacillus folatiphilus]UQS82489.1 CvfD/Ygs/GSP13 family RNA-binding post-transcriptional regulator [Bombilactobacillus folatiphilus]